MDPEFDTMLRRLRQTWRRADAAEREEILNTLWSLVPKAEDPEPEPARGRTSCTVACPCCGGRLTVELVC